MVLQIVRIICAYLHVSLCNEVRRKIMAKNLFYQYYGHRDFQNYQGFDIQFIQFIADKFSLNIKIFSWTQNNGSNVFELIKTSMFNPEYDDLCMLSFINHLCYVNNQDKLMKSIKCGKCDKLFKSTKQVNRHLKTCTETVKEICPKNDILLEPKVNLIQSLYLKYSVKIPENIKDSYFLYDYNITYDYETWMKAIKSLENDKTKMHCEHEALSCSVASDVPGFNEARILMTKKFKSLIEVVPEYYHNKEGKQKKSNEYLRLHQYINQIPMIGFNSQKYDIEKLISRFEVLPSRWLASKRLEALRNTFFSCFEAHGNASKRAILTEALRSENPTLRWISM
eukprot:Lithocolla_globosa_v1_NODE_138_length_5823_cov_17.507628.p2 type:complete len:339 gc:universal NODE_138_length_5823_cov_17.507628:5203-4187(-)